MAYIHPKTGGKIPGHESHRAHVFYEQTTKREMYLMIQQLAELCKEDDQHWLDRAEHEKKILKLNGIQ